MKRKRRILGGILAIVVLCSFVVLANSFAKREKQADRERVKISTKTLKQIPGNRSIYAFRQVYPDPVIENLHLPSGEDGRVIRALRFENITNVNEERYELPSHIISAMDMWEAAGQALLANSDTDGGFGFSHKQFGTAREFGMHVYSDCKKTICKDHHLELQQIVNQSKGDIKKLIKYDDRFHPVLDHDGTARMLAFHMGKALKTQNAVKHALRKYSGRFDYYKHIVEYMALLGDINYLKGVEKRFNAKNPDLKINGKPADFDEYIRVFQEQNYNYGLVAYGELPYLDIKNSGDSEKFNQKWVYPKRQEQIQKRLNKKEERKKKK